MINSVKFPFSRQLVNDHHFPRSPVLLFLPSCNYIIQIIHSITLLRILNGKVKINVPTFFYVIVSLLFLSPYSILNHMTCFVPKLRLGNHSLLTINYRETSILFSPYIENMCLLATPVNFPRFRNVSLSPCNTGLCIIVDSNTEDYNGL